MLDLYLEHHRRASPDQFPREVGVEGEEGLRLLEVGGEQGLDE